MNKTISHFLLHGLGTALTGIALACGGAAWAQVPTAPTVVHGQASFQRGANLLSISNTPGAIIQWQGFSIGAGETTRFVQQSAASSVLNRITGQDPSVILGSLQSNGRVFLINPNGVLFGAGARVDVNGLVASSLALSNADFLAGKLDFSGTGAEGRVASQGEIRTPQGGRILLVAPQVENSGLLHAPGGEVVLAAGRSVRLADSTNPDLQVVVSAPEHQALNLGRVVAQGGSVGIYGGLVRQRGIVDADSAVVGTNGKIVFKSSGDVLLESGSRTSATGAGKGGTIHLLGDRVGVSGDAQVDASGNAGGGTVLVGGDYQGSNPAIANARQVHVGAEATVRADALASGDGGKVVVWSDGATRMEGRISARGGAASGDGGFVEVSGGVLDLLGTVDTRASRGRTGQLLLDPTNIYIADDAAAAAAAGMTGDSMAETGPGGAFTGNGDARDSLLRVSSLQSALAFNNVTVSTDNPTGTGLGFIRVVSPIAVPDAPFVPGDPAEPARVLTLSAAAGIRIDAAISGMNYGALVLNTATGDIVQTVPVSIRTLTANAATGAVNLGLQNNVNRLAGSSGGAGGFTFRSTPGSTVNVGQGGVGSITAAGTGPITLDVGTLVVYSNITAAAGNVVLTAANDVTNNGTIFSTSGRVTVQGVVLRPSLADCIANRALANCAAVLPTLAACQAAPATPGCSVVLPPVPPAPPAPPPEPPPPSLDACVAAPTTTGCAAVLPSLSGCIANTAAAGCSVVLPPLALCTAAPSTPGCAVVLPSLGVCVAAPGTAGCTAVLPSLPACVANPAAAGCSVVLPSLNACIASPTSAGCSVVLPALGACVANPSTPGCGVVLPSLAACTASPATAGCGVVLPSVAQCSANPSRAGCSAVLPSLASCVANPTLAGCAVVLPSLLQCTAAPSAAGCSAVLPTVAQCTASPTLQGCGAVLPPVSACVANPSTPGCVVVLPPGQSQPNSPVAQSTNSTVNLINTAAADTVPAGVGGAGGTGGAGSALTDGTYSSPATAKKDEPAKKTYCN